MLTLVNEGLDLSGIEAGELRMQPEALALDGLLRTVFAEVGNTGPGRSDSSSFFAGLDGMFPVASG